MNATPIYTRIDSDAHVLEPVDFWKAYTEQRYRDRVPEMVVDGEGNEQVRAEGKVLLHDARNIGNTDARHSSEILSYTQGRKGGHDPDARIADMNIDRIDAAFLYPTLGLLTGGIEDAALAGALARAYNRWLADFCAPYPERLFGVAMLPMQSIELAVAEMRYARSELGMRAGLIRPNPYNNRLLSDPAYDALWAAAQELDFSIGLHNGSGGMPSAGIDRVVGRDAKHIAAHTLEMMLASLNLIWSGVCERFPKLRFGFLESGGGWVPAWLDRMDRHYGEKFRKTTLTMKPSDYFKRQCWISFEPTEGTLPLLADYIGPRRILWATDYPHHDGWFPGAPDMIEKALPEALRQDVLAQSAIAFYNLH